MVLLVAWRRWPDDHRVADMRQFARLRQNRRLVDGDEAAAGGEARTDCAVKCGDSSPSRNSINYSFQLSGLGRPDRKAFYMLLAPPEHCRRCPSLIPRGDQYSSRGQRPRRTCPPQGPTQKGANPGGVTPLRVIRPFQGRGTNLAHSEGIAPGYYLVPLQGTKNLPFGLSPRRPFLTSRIAIFGYTRSE